MKKRALGQGKAIHLGSTFSRKNTEWLFSYLGIKEPFADMIDVPEGVEIVERKKGDKKYLFILNFQVEKTDVLLKKEMKLLYTGEIVCGEQGLPAYGTAVYEVL